MEQDILELKTRLEKMEHFQQAIYRGIVDKIDSIPVNYLKEGLLNNKQQTLQLENRLNEIEKKIDFLLPMMSLEFSSKHLDNKIRCIQGSKQNGGEEKIKTIEQEEEQSNLSINLPEQSFESQVKAVETEFSDFEETSDYNDDTANNSELESIPIDDSHDADEDISFSIVFGDFDCFDDFDQLRYDRSEIVENESSECIQFGEATNILEIIEHGPDLYNIADMQIEDPFILDIIPAESKMAAKSNVESKKAAKSIVYSNMAAISTVSNRAAKTTDRNMAAKSVDSNRAAKSTVDANMASGPKSFLNMAAIPTDELNKAALPIADSNRAVKPIDDTNYVADQNFNSNIVVEAVEFGEATQVYTEIKYDSCLHYVHSVKPSNSSHFINKPHQQINSQPPVHSGRGYMEPTCLDFGDASDILRKLQPKECKST